MNRVAPRAEGLKRVPLIVITADLKALPIGPEEAFVLSRVDGVSSERDIALATGLASSDVTLYLERLVAVGAITFPPVATATAPTTARNEPPVAGASAPAPLTVDVFDDASLRLLLGTLALQDHYEVLAVPRSAEKAELKAAYFSVVSRFHPDQYYGQDLGARKALLSAIFQRLTEAHDALTRKKSRAAYDATLGTPSGKTSSQPSGKTSSQPSGKTSSQPSGKTSSQPSGSAKAPAPENTRPPASPNSLAPPASASPANASAPPPRASAPPPRASAPPPRASAPPPRASAPPPRASAPPPRHSVPPARASAPPPRASAPPARHSVPPARASAPPARASAPPARHSVPPARASAPPARHSVPPARASAPPPRASAPPARHSVPPTGPAGRSSPRWSEFPPSPPPPIPRAPAPVGAALPAQAPLTPPLHAPGAAGAANTTPPVSSPISRKLAMTRGLRPLRSLAPDGAAASVPVVSSMPPMGHRGSSHYVAAAKRSEAEGDLLAAVNSLRIARTLAPDDERVQRLLDETERRAETELADQYREQGEELEKQGEARRAAALYLKAARGKNSPHLFARAARLALSAGNDLKGACLAAKRAVELLPDDANLRFLLGSIYSTAGMKASANAEFDKARELAPRDKDLLALLKTARQ